MSWTKNAEHAAASPISRHTQTRTHILKHTVSVAEKTLFSGGLMGTLTLKRCLYQMPCSFLLLKNERGCVHMHVSVTHKNVCFTPNSPELYIV